MSAEITPTHVAKFLRRKMITKDFGNVIIRIQDGVIVHVSENFDYNVSAFVGSVENPVSRLVVKSNKNKEKVVVGENSTESTIVDEDVENSIKKGVES